MAKAISFLCSVHPYPMSERFPLPGACHLEIVVAVCGSQTLEDLAQNLVMGGNYPEPQKPRQKKSRVDEKHQVLGSKMILSKIL